MALNNKLFINDARVIFKNFSGKEGTYNRAGDRSFCVVIDDIQTIDRLRGDGWNVKQLAPRDADDEPTFYIRVKVKYGEYPPKAYMVTRKKKTLLDENSINQLDRATITSADLTISPYSWDINGRTGVTAYLETGYFVLEEDVWADKYRFDDEGELPFA